MEPFLFIAGHPALDFLNTEKRNDAGERVELLSAPECVAAWYREAGFGPITASDALLTDARALRDAIRTLVTAWISGDDTAPEAPRDLLNQILATGAARSVLAADFSVGTKRVSEAASPLLPVAEAAWDLFANHPRDLVRQCGGTGCVLWFLDTTKNKRRRWCRMDVCGNRMKVAAHYHRHHGNTA